MAVIGEYRFVFTDEVKKSRSNESLSSTTEDIEKNKTDSLPESPMYQKQLKKFTSIAAKGIGTVGAGLKIHGTVRDIVYNKLTTDAIISGNLQAARHLQTKKTNQDRIINRTMGLVGYAVQGAAIGAMGGPVLSAAMAAVSMAVGISLSLAKRETEFQENMRRYMAELSEQRYVGYLESRRLVNLTGRMR